MQDNKVFMTTDEFGDLYIIDVLVKYIYPVSFVCQDKFESNYLFYEIMDDDSICKWNVVKITKKEYYAICDRKQTIQKAYKNANKRDLFSFEKNYENDTITISPISEEDLLVLPKNDVYAEKESIDNKASETLKESRNKCASILDFRFFAGMPRHLLSSTHLNELISNVKSLFKTFFNVKRTDPIEACTLPGSCIVRFQFPDAMNLFDETDASNELLVFSKILANESIMDNINIVIDKKDFITKYTEFLNTIKKIGSDVQISSASPNSNTPLYVELKYDTIKRRYKDAREIYSTKISEDFYTGVLVAFDTIKKKFNLKCNGEYISGDVNKNCSALDEKNLINSEYRAKIKRTLKVDEKNLSVSSNYELIELTGIVN